MFEREFRAAKQSKVFCSFTLRVSVSFERDLEDVLVQLGFTKATGEALGLIASGAACNEEKERKSRYEFHV